MRLFNEWVQIQDIGKPGQGLRLELVADGFVNPLCLRHDGERLYIVDQIGKIWIHEDGELKKKPFFDMSDLVRSLPPAKKGSPVGLDPEHDERGLLGMTLHPQYNRNGRLFVACAMKQKEKNDKFNNDLVILELQAGRDHVNLTGHKELFRIPEETASHNGADLQFGPDGYLYIAIGDGGCCGDKFSEIGNGQNLGTLKGKILRIDPHRPGKYRIPKDNPFVNIKGARPEIWAYGFRNPWRMSFDGNKLYVGVVGEGAEEIGDGWESIFIVKKGGNHGWRIREGTHYFDKDLMKKLGLKPSDLVDPIHEYDHKVGVAVIGGYVYRGDAAPELKGSYVFGNWSKNWETPSGALYYLKRKGDKWHRYAFKYPDGRSTMDYFITSLGEGPDKELYVLGNKTSGVDEKGKKGVVFKLVS